MMRRSTHISGALMAVLAVFLLPSFAGADIYTYIDAAGVVHFTNVPDDPLYRPVASLREAPGGFMTRVEPDSSGWSRGGALDPDSLNRIIWRAARRYQVDPRLVKAVIKAESNFDTFALSRRGAQGLMQLMPATAVEMRVADPFNPEDNISGGTRYLRKMLGIFNGNLRLSLAAYNAGPETVIRRGGIPDYRETIRYVKRVDYYYNQFIEASSPSKRWAKYFYNKINL